MLTFNDVDINNYTEENFVFKHDQRSHIIVVVNIVFGYINIKKTKKHTWILLTVHLFSYVRKIFYKFV